MPLTFEPEGADKDQLVTSLAAIILSDCGADITAESIQTVITASKNSVPAYYPTLFASYIEKAGGLDKFFAGPTAGGGGGGAAPAAAAAQDAAPAAEAAPEEEEVDALAGGMDMFGGGDGGGGDY